MADAPARTACVDYFAARGCTVDAASGLAEAEPLLRRHVYDKVVTDLPMSDEVLEMFALARRRNPSAVPILLTTEEEQPYPGSLTTFVKPFPLSVLLAR